MSYPKPDPDQQPADHRGRRAPRTGSGDVKGSGAPAEDFDSDPQGGNSQGTNPTGESRDNALRHKGRRTSA